MANYTIADKKKEILSKFCSPQLAIIQSLSNYDNRKVEELDINEFLAVLYFSNAQFNAPCFERRMSLKGWKKVPASDNNGDFKVKGFDRNIELKCSFPNKANTINLRQIRLWQDTDYIITFCDYCNYKHIVLFLTHEEMKEAVKKFGTASHGTSKANEENKNIEYSITIKLNDMEYWKKYENKKLMDFMFS